MNRPLRIVLIPPLLAFIAGCAHYEWRKQGATQNEFNNDSYQCQMEAARVYPAVMVNQQVTTGYVAPATTNCYSNGSAYGSAGNVYGNSTTTCTTTPGQVVQPISYTADANQGNRAQAIQSCLYARGYQLVEVARSGGGGGGDDCTADRRTLLNGKWVCR